MNEQASMMKQHQQQQMMNPQPPVMASSMSQPPPPQLMSQHHQQQQPQILMNLPPQSQQPSQMMNRSYAMWGPPPPPQHPMDLQLNYQNHNPSLMKTQPGAFVPGGKPPLKQHHLGPRNNWKGKRVNKHVKRMDLGGRRMDKPLPIGGSSSSGVVGNIGGGYKPPTLNELQHQNRMKSRRYFPKKNFNNKNSHNMGKFAPRNTSSFIIRAKKSGGIAELVSPCPVTPAVLPTPMFSPSREVLVDMAKEEWGVDGYGSMKGLIRLRSPGHDTVEGHDDEEEDEGGSSESDVEEHVEVERRLDHDLSRFEMIYPSYGTATGVEFNNVLENRVDDQDTHIGQLEEENLILKERLFLMERELGDLRRRLQCLERRNRGREDINEEVVENYSENESESSGDAHSVEVNNEEIVEADGEDKINLLDAGKFQYEADLADVRGAEESKDDISKVRDMGVELINNDHKDNVVTENKASLEAPRNNNAMEENTANLEAHQDNNGIEPDVKEENNASLEALENNADVLMQEEVQSEKEMITENQTNQEAADNQGLEKGIGEGDFSSCPSSVHISKPSGFSLFQTPGESS